MEVAGNAQSLLILGRGQLAEHCALALGLLGLLELLDVGRRAKPAGNLAASVAQPSARVAAPAVRQCPHDSPRPTSSSIGLVYHGVCAAARGNNRSDNSSAELGRSACTPV